LRRADDFSSRPLGGEPPCRLRVLVVAEDVPYPPDQGDRIRCVNLIRGLATRHEVTLLCFEPATPTVRASWPLDIKEYLDCSEVITVPREPGLPAAFRFLFRPLDPVTVVRRRSPAMTRRVAELVRNQGCDVALAYQLKMAPYVADLQGVFRVADLTDSLTLYFERAAAFARSRAERGLFMVEAVRTARMERLIRRRLDLITLSSAEDVAKVESLGPGATVIRLPNGVPDDWIDGEDERRPVGSGQVPALLFVGNMAYRPNEDAVLWLAREALPCIRESVPEAHLLVVGKNPSRRVQALQGRAAVRVVGPVPDIRDWLRKATVLVAPLRFGSGTPFKVLEAMAVGLPVVTSPLAARALGAQPGRHVEVAEDAAGLAERVRFLLRDRSARQALARRGREFVKASYLRSSIMERFLTQLDRQMASRSLQ